MDHIKRTSLNIMSNTRLSLILRPHGVHIKIKADPNAGTPVSISISGCVTGKKKERRKVAWKMEGKKQGWKEG